MRSVSEPALRVSCGSYSRERSRLTDLAYERGKDNVAHWIGAWSFEEVGYLSLKFAKATLLFCYAPLPPLYWVFDGIIWEFDCPNSWKFDYLRLHS